MNRPSNKRRRDPAESVTRWNEQHPIGTSVTVKLDSGETRATTTRSEAHVLSGHTAVIWLEGITGCYLLDRVSPSAASRAEVAHG